VGKKSKEAGKTIAEVGLRGINGEAAALLVLLRLFFALLSTAIRSVFANCMYMCGTAAPHRSALHFRPAHRIIDTCCATLLPACTLLYTFYLPAGLFLFEIERADGTLLKAVSHDTVLHTGDVLWFAGDLEGVAYLQKYTTLEHMQADQVAKLESDIIHRRLVQVRRLNSSLSGRHID
jgi:hypothetical protein